MIHPLNIATDGYLCNPLGIVSNGYLCLEEIQFVEDTVKKRKGSSSKKPLTLKQRLELNQKLKNEELIQAIKREDEELFLMIKLFLKCQ